MGDHPSLPLIYVSYRNNVNFMIYWKPLNYFEKILKYSTPPKFGRLCMRFILITYGIQNTAVSIKDTIITGV